MRQKILLGGLAVALGIGLLLAGGSQVRALTGLDGDDGSDATTTETTDLNNYFEGRGYDGTGLAAPDAATETPTGVIKSGNLNKVIIGWTNFTLGFLFVIAVGVLIYAGFNYIVAEDKEKSKKLIIGVVAGLIIIISSYAIVATVISRNAGRGKLGVGEQCLRDSDCMSNNCDNQPIVPLFGEVCQANY